MINEYVATEAEELGAIITEKQVELNTLQDRLEELQGEEDPDTLIDINDLQDEIRTLEGEIEVDESELLEIWDRDEA